MANAQKPMIPPPAIMRNPLFDESDSEDEDAVDTNVISIQFDILKEAKKNMAMGDPVFCKNCKAVLNKRSHVMEAKEYLGYIDKQHEQNL